MDEKDCVPEQAMPEPRFPNHEFVRLEEVLVGIDKSKQVDAGNGQLRGGEIWSTFVFRASMLHSVFRDGSDWIIWIVQGSREPLRQRASAKNLRLYERFAASVTPVAFDGPVVPAIRLTPEACQMRSSPVQTK